MVTHKAIRTVHSETSGVNQETNVSVIDTLDSSCLMERDPKEWRKARRKDIYLAFCRELVLLVEYLDKHRLSL